MSFDDVSIVTVRKYRYRIQFSVMTKGDFVSRMKNANLSEKSSEKTIIMEK